MTTYEALARKYRPRTFEELVGQKPIVRTLSNAIRAGRIHHAYVFSGVRGVGKTTVARILAKALNCEKGPTPSPCLACAPCVEIAAGQDMDVIELDAASRTGVDDVRDLIDTTRYAPARDSYKVFIIDEFHMLSKPAFNALLKTLEEPPPRVVFVMATTELHKVPPTVLSRTQQFDFRKVPADEIADLLARIAAKEKILASRSCLDMLARAADGSVRDAESLLDQAIASCGPQLDEEDLRTLLGLVPEETVEAFFASAAGRDAGGLVRLIDAVITEGHDLRIFLAGLIEGARRLLLLRTVDKPSEILGLMPEHEKRLAALAEQFDTVALLRIISVLMGLEGPLKYSEQPRYVLEAAAIRIATIGDLAPIEDLIARFEDAGRGPSPDGPDGPHGPGGPGGPDAPAPTPGGGGRAEAAPRTARPSSPTQAGGPGGSTRPTTPASRPATRPSAPPTKTPRRGSNEADLHEDPASTGSAPETRFLEALHARKLSLAILVEQASSIFLEGDRLVLVFDDSSAFARKSVEQEGNLATLREIAADCLGRPAGVEVRRAGADSLIARPPALDPLEDGQGSAPPRTEQAALDEPTAVERPPEPAAPPQSRSAFAAQARFENGTESSATGQTGDAKRRRLLSEALEDPIVKTLIERFDGRIVEVKEAQ